MPAPKDPARKEEWRRNLSVANKGNIRQLIKGTPEWELWLGKARSGHTRFMDDPVAQKQWRDNLSIALSGRSGKTVTAETRRRISLSLKGVRKPPRSIQHSLKISLANTGKRLSVEHRRIASETLRSARGSDAWKKSMAPIYAARKGVPRNPDHIAKMVATRKLRGNYNVSSVNREAVGHASRTRKRTDGEKLKIANALRGRKRDPAIALKISETKRLRRTRPYPEKRARDPRYKPWRNAVLERDNYSCRRCGHKDKGNHAHHLHGWDNAPDLRYSTDNAITLCNGCHTKTHAEERRQQRGLQSIA